MRLPRDLSGLQLAKSLDRFGYRMSRQTGSHIRLTTDLPTQHHITVPAHDPLRVGTLAAILWDVASHRKISRDNLLDQMGL